MVVLKGGGTTYAVGNGRQMAWGDVPGDFKQRLAEQEEIAPCVEMRKVAQCCIESQGFWAPDCVAATERFHDCQSRYLATRLPGRPHSAGNSNDESSGRAETHGD
uniref:CHCH domain-containing protein n=1 Tax=Trypanosoma congolense (strain IL3000) TaxID=1068625 RepID=G0UMB8_TRYCI|nr:conserved hypothetical protein [Trypanosoma congolense IL3000]